MTSENTTDLVLILVPSAIILGLTLWLVARILRKAGYNGWWALVMLVPLVNLVMIWVFAHADWPALARGSGAGASSSRAPKPGYEAGGTIVDRDHRPESERFFGAEPGHTDLKWMLTGFNGAGHAVRLEFSSDDVAARDGLIIGRSSQQSDLVLDDTSVSRRHARLFTGHGLLQIEDLESANGTSVDGRVLGVEEIAELGEGAELIFGETKLRLSIS